MLRACVRRAAIGNGPSFDDPEAYVKKVDQAFFRLLVASLEESGSRGPGVLFGVFTTFSVWVSPSPIKCATSNPHIHFKR
jgi:hypothetical protein